MIDLKLLVFYGFRNISKKSVTYSEETWLFLNCSSNQIKLNKRMENIAKFTEDFCPCWMSS